MNQKYVTSDKSLRKCLLFNFRLLNFILVYGRQNFSHQAGAHELIM